MTKSKNQPNRKCIDCVHNVIGVCMRTRMPVGISYAACEKSHVPAYAETVCRGCRGVCNPEECDHDASSGSCTRLRKLTKPAEIEFKKGN